MDPALVAAVAQAAAGEKINVAEVCRETGVTRSVFYVKLERFKADGSAGLAPLATRTGTWATSPLRAPTSTRPTSRRRRRPRTPWSCISGRPYRSFRNLIVRASGRLDLTRVHAVARHGPADLRAFLGALSRR